MKTCRREVLDVFCTELALFGLTLHSAYVYMYCMSWIHSALIHRTQPHARIKCKPLIGHFAAFAFLARLVFHSRSTCACITCAFPLPRLYYLHNIQPYSTSSVRTTFTDFIGLRSTNEAFMCWLILEMPCLFLPGLGTTSVTCLQSHGQHEVEMGDMLLPRRVRRTTSQGRPIHVYNCIYTYPRPTLSLWCRRSTIN